MNRLHPFSAVTAALHRGLLGMSLPFLLMGVLAAVTDSVDPSGALYLVPVGFIAGVAYGVASYYRFEYELTQNTFDVSSGVFSRRSREIPFRRVQNVDVRQGIVQQLLGVAVVQIETAGGGSTEAQLSVVAKSEADRLQREIRRLTATAGATDSTESDGQTESIADSDGEYEYRGEETRVDSESGVDSGRGIDSEGRVDSRRDVESEGRVGEETIATERQARTESHQETDYAPKLLFELAPRELLLYSFASFRVAAAAGLFFLVLFLTDPIIDILLSAAAPFGGPADLGSASPQQFGVLSILSLVYGIAVTYLFSVVYTFLGYYDFRLGRAGDDLVYERGLLQRYSGSIPVGKIQSVTVTDNPIQRLIGYAGLGVETAGYGPDSGGGSQSAVPLTRKQRAYWFAERLTGVDTPKFDRPTTVARRRYLARYSLVAGAVVLLAFGVSLVTSFDRWWLLVPIFLAVPPAAHLRWVNLGYHVGDDHIVIRAGFWRRRTTVVPYYRVQTISTRRSIFQRRLGLASLVVDTASSRALFWSAPTIYDLEYSVASEIHDVGRERLQSAMAERAASTGFDESDIDFGDAGDSVAFT